MSSRTRILSIALAAALLAPLHAVAQTATGPPCGRRANIGHFLAMTFGERLVSRGVSEGGLLVEIFAGPTGTWTILATNPAGVSCLLASGDGWERPAEPGVDS